MAMTEIALFLIALLAAGVCLSMIEIVPLYRNGSILK